MNFLANTSPEWFESQYLLWKQSPDSVTRDWQLFFEGYELGESGEHVQAEDERFHAELAFKQSSVESLIYRYRDNGHLLACTDPLSPCPISHPLLELSAFNLDESDLDTVFQSRRFLKRSVTLREIVETLRQTYCHSIGVEFMHIQDPAERQWLMERMEPVRNAPPLERDEKLRILGKLQEAALFEAFLHRKFLGQKRFSLEGGEALIPFLDRIVRRATDLGVSDLMLGMAHRGRLNVLANILQKPLQNIFAEFEDNLEHQVVGEGDVKYHKGFSRDLQVDGKSIHLALAFNPSHLEVVDPVVEGKARARQDRYGADSVKRVLPLLIHGDAAFAGQGVVAEVLNLSQLEGYGTGGTIHVIVNNQIGFTTVPADARSTRYATDVAKMLMVPIFHVHGEDPEAAVHVAALALEYRQTFRRDVVVEIICYRRYGHNEGDEPNFTQPLMYDRIKNRPPVHEIYASNLVESGISREIIDAMLSEVSARLEASTGKPPEALDLGFSGNWSSISRDYAPVKVETGVSRAMLVSLAGQLESLPAGFAPHPKVAALLKRRNEAVRSGEGIDWGNAETLAFATLVAEGIPVRVSGQDSRRGTFNHRHSVLHDMETNQTFVPLSALAKPPAQYNAWDSMLSENAVLGFEYGYSVETPEGLTIWEAQFGDFANGAQVIIDQFIASGESKWDRVSGLVMLLPHGYEGQGAEHSSARIERYLQLCADNNLQVAYPSTPAQFFHLLRRQVKQPFRKPLIVFSPKSLFRHPLCVSRLDELAGDWFNEVIPAPEPADQVRTVLVCSGKVYYDLLEQKMAGKRSDVAIVRVEQLYPLRADLLRDALTGYRNVRTFAWVQEEPRNMGAWWYIRPHLSEILGREPRYVGRRDSATPAVGSHRLHKVEQDRLVAEAFATE